MKNQRLNLLDLAEKQVSRIKNFYYHLAVYIVLNSVIILGQGKTTFTFLGQQLMGAEFLDAVNWDVFGTPIVWGVLLLIHAANVFGKRRFFNTNWERRQIAKYMKEERLEVEKYK